MYTARCVLIILLTFLPSELNSSSLRSSKHYNTLFETNSRLIKELSKNSKLNNTRERTVEPPLLIGSFNIQTLGRKKFANSLVMNIVKKVILRYDLIFVTELMDDRFIPNLLKEVNHVAGNLDIYNVIVSEKKSETQEQYAYFYKKNKLKVIKEESYDDPKSFYRKPFIAIFEASTLRDMRRFGVIGHHVKPSNATREIDALADVYDYVTRIYETEDVLLMGDFNADCAYVKEKDWNNISLWTRTEFTWAITGNMDTTTNYKSCTLDRFVYAGENMNNGVILSSARVFNFQQEYELSINETRAVSDHFPIELKIRGKMSEIAEKNLMAGMCFKIRDARKMHNITTENLISAAMKSAFLAVKTVDGVIFRNKTIAEGDMLAALKRLRFNIPDVVTPELEDAVTYKVQHGSLKDDSSFADIYEAGYKIDVLTTNDFTEITICRSTSVN